eukprot:908865-Pelagomonas_calceolata.AAC.2
MAYGYVPQQLQIIKLRYSSRVPAHGVWLCPGVWHVVNRNNHGRPRRNLRPLLLIDWVESVFPVNCFYDRGSQVCMADSCGVKPRLANFNECFMMMGGRLVPVSAEGDLGPEANPCIMQFVGPCSMPGHHAAWSIMQLVGPCTHALALSSLSQSWDSTA